MKITKFPQSCLMIETKGKKILVDPGKIKYDSYYFSMWSKDDIILITHRHGDHCHYEELKKMNNVPIYSTKEVKNQYPDLLIEIVKDGDIFKLDNIKIETVKAIHGYNPLLKNGGEVKENVGYIIDDGNKRVKISSDTICFNNDYKAAILVLPVTGHGLTMSAYEASLLAKEMDASLTLIVHLDNDFYPVDMNFVRDTFDNNNSNYKILETGEAIEI